MVGDGLAVFWGARNRLQELFAHQAVEQLRVVEYIEMPVKVRVLIADGIKAVRAGGDDFPLAFGHARKSVVEGFDVLLRHHLEQELVAGAASGIAGAGLTGRKHAELHAGGVQ